MRRLSTKAIIYAIVDRENWRTRQAFGYCTYRIPIGRYGDDLIAHARGLEIDHELNVRKYTVLAPTTRQE